MKKFLFTSIVLGILWTILGGYLYTAYGDAPMSGHFGKRWWNNEASAHFLNSLGRYHQRPISEHWFAIAAPCDEPPEKPCVKSGRANVVGSAVVSSERLANEDVYTSFPPGSMIIASFFVFNLSDVLNIDLIQSLRGFNWFLSLVSVLLFFYTLAKISYIPHKQGIWLAGMATLPLLVSVEVMHSHHLSFWAHQVFQPVLALILLVSTSSITTWRSIALGVLCAIACWIEWTGFLLSLAIGIFIFLQSAPQSRTKNFIVFSFFSLLGLITLLVYYEQLIGLQSYFNSLLVRFSARTVVTYYTWHDWYISVMQSYGPWIITIIILGVFASFKRVTLNADQIPTTGEKKKTLGLLAVTAFILLENALMFEHSIVYTFDRLKIGFFLGFLIMFFGTMAIQKYPKRGFYYVAFFVIMGASYSLYDFTRLYVPYWK